MRETDRKEERREGEAYSQFRFHTPIIAQASAEACPSHGIHEVLTTYSKRLT